MLKYFDAHAHIQLSQYDEDRRELLARMKDEGFGALVVGVDKDSSKKAITLVETHDNLFATVGLHPNDVFDEEFVFDEYKALAMRPKVMAIGECGLDYFRPENADHAIPKQKEVFEQHIELAAQLDKPLMIHPRPSKGTMDAYRDLIDILRSKKKLYGDKLRGDCHFFVGGVDEARDLIELGFTISFTAVITFARDYDDVIRYAPLSSILTETDAPFVAPKSRRGKRNDPLAVSEVVDALSEVRKEDRETVRGAVLANALKLFSIPV